MIELLTGWLLDWLTDSLIDWLTNWLTDWLSEWLIDWHHDFMIDWVHEWLTDWLTDSLTDSRTQWCTDWLTDWLNDWLTDRMFDSDRLAGSQPANQQISQRNKLYTTLISAMHSCVNTSQDNISLFETEETVINTWRRETNRLHTARVYYSQTLNAEHNSIRTHSIASVFFISND